MHLTVGPYSYSVLKTQNLSHPIDNEAIDGLIDFATATIWIDQTVPAHRRLDVILHEYWHAWRHHFGKPEDEEAECDWFAAAVMQFLREWHLQGCEFSLSCLDSDTPANRTQLKMVGRAMIDSGTTSPTPEAPEAPEVASVFKHSS